MESALIASSVVADAVAEGRSYAARLSAYEDRFREYFDPALRYVDFCAAVMRNWHLRDFWLRVVARSCRRAAEEGEFARVAGAAFGGLNVQPINILSHLWVQLIEDISGSGARFLLDALSGRMPSGLPWLDDVWTFSEGWWRSVFDDPSWHATWTGDVLQKWALVASRLHIVDDPRMQGPLHALA